MTSAEILLYVLSAYIVVFFPPIFNDLRGGKNTNCRGINGWGKT